MATSLTVRVLRSGRKSSPVLLELWKLRYSQSSPAQSATRRKDNNANETQCWRVTSEAMSSSLATTLKRTSLSVRPLRAGIFS